MKYLLRFLDFRYIYIGTTSRRRWLIWPYAFKIGIARDVAQRWRDIDKSISRTDERPVFFARVLFARSLEQSLLRSFRPVKMPGSGRTEWRRLNLFQLAYCIGTIILYSLVGVLSGLGLLLWAVLFFAEVLQ